MLKKKAKHLEERNPEIMMMSAIDCIVQLAEDSGFENEFFDGSFEKQGESFASIYDGYSYSDCQRNLSKDIDAKLHGGQQKGFQSSSR